MSNESTVLNRAESPHSNHSDSTELKLPFTRQPTTMSKAKRTKIEVQGTAITIVSQNSQDFISLTDMAQKFGDDVLIYSWMRNRNTLEFIGIWEKIHNPDFKSLEFETFRNQAGLNSFSLTPRKWIEATGAILPSTEDVRTVGRRLSSDETKALKNPGKREGE